MRPTPVLLALLCAALAAPAAAPARSGDVTVYPALAFAGDLGAVHARSGLAVLLPERVRIPSYANAPYDFRAIGSATSAAYDLSLVNRACAPAAACRRPLSFTAERTSDAPAGDLRLARGRLGSLGTATCTGGGCTPASITWIERHARYTLYANVGPRRLRAYANDAIRHGPRS